MSITRMSQLCVLVAYSVISCLLFVGIGDGAIDDLWSSYRYDTLNTGSKAVLGPQDNMTYVSGMSTSVGYTGSACVSSSGIAIIGDLNAVVRAFDVNSMEMIWSSDNMYGNRTDLNLGTYMSSSPTLSADENEVFITTFVGNDVAIYSLNSLNGSDKCRSILVYGFFKLKQRKNATDKKV